MDHQESPGTPVRADDAADDTDVVEPPRLRRLGTLAELTRGGGLGSDDVLGGGFQGEGGDSFPNA